jgi:hypothetical protein
MKYLQVNFIPICMLIKSLWYDFLFNERYLQQLLS